MEGQSENCFSSHTHAMEYYSSVVRNKPPNLEKHGYHSVKEHSLEYDLIYDILGKANR